MKKQTKIIDGLSPGQRLDIVILKYFGKQKNFAQVANLLPNAVSRYVTGGTITKKAALDMQKFAGVNADYILNGNMPMMLTEKEAVYKEDASSIVSVVGSIKQNKEYAEATRGEVFNIVISKRGNRTVVSQQGHINIVDAAINGIQDPAVVTTNEVGFCEKYCIPLNSNLVINKNITSGDIVLIADDENCYLCLYSTKDKKQTFTDIRDRAVIGGQVKVMGAVYSALYSRIPLEYLQK